MQYWRVGLTRWRILSSASLVAVLCALVLWSRVYVDFDGVRMKVLQEPRPATRGEVRVTLPESPRFGRLSPPVVLIATLHNPRAHPSTIVASLNGERIGAATLPPGDRRIDLVIPDARPVHAGDVVTFVAFDEGHDPAATGTGTETGTETPGATPWSLDYLEVANHHGSSRAILVFFIVPRETRAYTGPGAALDAFAAIVVLFLVSYGWTFLQQRRARLAQLVLTIVVLLIFSTVLASGTFSEFKLLFSPRAFVLCALALTWPGIVRVFNVLRESLGARAAWARFPVEATLAAGLVAWFYLSVVQVLLASHQGNYSGFLQVGETFAGRVPFLTDRPDLRSQLRINSEGGYDGQFAYAMAFDPALLAFKDDPVRYRDVVDAPPYRYGRIGFSLLTKLFSGDRPERYPQTMVWLIVGASFIGALLLAAIARDNGYSAGWALLYVLVPGFLESLRTALPEAIAAVGLIGGYWLLRRKRPGWAAALFAASLLVRETGIIFVIALVLWEALRTRDRRTAAVLAASALPMIVWRGYVGWRLFPDFHWQAFFFNPRTTGIPFKGLVDLWTQVRDGRYYDGAADMAAAGTFYPLLLVVAFAVAAYLLWARRDGLAVAIVAYACLAVSLNFEAVWLHVGNGERTTYEAILLLIVAFVTTERRAHVARGILGGFMMCAFLYLWLASVDSGLLRYTFPV
jgi:hypothetical protein